MIFLQSRSDLTVWDGGQAVPRSWMLEHVSDAEGLYCLLTDSVDAEILIKASRLKVVSTMAVGFDNIDVAECSKRGIPVGHTPGVLTETTADFAFALMMTAARRIVEGAAYVQNGQWQTWSPTLFLGQDLHGATLGIIGFGRIGQAVARRAAGFDMKVLVSGSSRNEQSKDKNEPPMKYVDLPTLLANSDFVTLHVPLKKETQHLIGARELKLMKKTAVLVNTARGPVVNSKALYQALSRGDIAFAALDVTDPEPIKLDDPLLTLSNCLVVPHIASASVTTRNKMAMMAAENLLAGLKGNPLPHCVNPEVYRR
ncbi:MAG: D-glycerate dehydrogenase [Nitrospirota bacterium]|nr:MAG: D-glycerate dehydrogenase [Nitrospirota bacterium]